MKIANMNPIGSRQRRREPQRAAGAEAFTARMPAAAPSATAVSTPAEDFVDTRRPTPALRRGRIEDVEAFERPSSREAWQKKMRVFNALFLLTPLVVASVYLFGIASNRYVAESVIAIRNPASGVSGVPGSMVGQVGQPVPSQAERAIDESYAVVNYIKSREAFDELNNRINLTPRMQETSIDWFGRLSPEARHERQYQHYLSQIDVSYDDLQGQISLTTYGYDADTAFKIGAELSRMSEQLVNQFNERARADMIKLAQDQVAEAAGEMRRTNQAITDFQLSHGMIDPTVETTSYGTIIQTLRDQIASKRAEMTALSKTSTPTSPRTSEIRNMLDALEVQLTSEQQRLTGKTDALAPLIGSYKMLTVDQGLAQQKYSSATAMLQSALVQAEMKKLYIVNIVSPRVPVDPILPNKQKSLLWVLAGTIIAWIIARLALASIRDHRV